MDAVSSARKRQRLTIPREHLRNRPCELVVDQAVRQVHEWKARHPLQIRSDNRAADIAECGDCLSEHRTGLIPQIESLLKLLRRQQPVGHKLLAESGRPE